MVDVRQAAAAVLGIGLGLLFVVYPRAVVRIHAVGRRPDQTGDYGTDDLPQSWLRLVQGLGVVGIAAGSYFAYLLVT